MGSIIRKLGDNAFDFAIRALKLASPRCWGEYYVD